ncbi:MAG: alginate export family protein, partial [Flavobacteriales bacterium]
LDRVQNGDKDQQINYSRTAGTRLVYDKGALNLTGAFYYQFGKDASHMDLNAFYGMGQAGYKATENISLKLGYEHLSGTDETDANNDENNSFTPFYGTNHKFNGFMDYFYVGNHVNSVGLMDPYLKLRYKKDKFSAGLHTHYFMSAAEVLDKKAFSETGNREAMDNGLGTEVDLTLGYKINPNVTVKAGYSHMFPTETMETLKGVKTSEVQNWGWLMIDFKPDFFKL